VSDRAPLPKSVIGLRVPATVGLTRGLIAHFSSGDLQPGGNGRGAALLAARRLPLQRPRRGSRQVAHQPVVHMADDPGIKDMLRFNLARDTWHQQQRLLGIEQLRADGLSEIIGLQRRRSGQDAGPHLLAVRGEQYRRRRSLGHR